MYKIIIVDDSRATLTALRAQINENELSVYTAQSAKEAHTILDQTQIDCILTDYEMPEIDGPTFCKQLKSSDKHKNIPVIMLTSMSGPEYLLTAIQAGADDFISKDSDFRIILAKITAMLRIKHYQDELTRLRRVEGIKQIVATYNHEFNNPLTIALGNLNWLKKNPLNEDQKRRIDRLSDSLERMTDLVKKIRDLREYVETAYANGENFVAIDKTQSHSEA